MSVYTKQGDQGATKVFDRKSGQLVRVSKKSCQIKSIGSIDELNSFLGIAISLSKDKDTKIRLRKIQSDLFTINSILAGSSLKFLKSKVNKLEREIDSWEAALPVQMNFIHYSGSMFSSYVFYARAISRRAERSLVSFSKKNFVPENILAYMNRLSDWLFILGRMVNNKNGVKEVYWVGSSKK